MSQDVDRLWEQYLADREDKLHEEQARAACPACGAANFATEGCEHCAMWRDALEIR